ncbi:hypothetical protein J4E90_008981 [Alternaria incomplexa]|uniref:uncharacterized protein n=1 Tax=Alternaria incomplexa TaxID=1187928 RepID=UPI002220ECBE|nr:uncharacterized protein J4E90_008981 [Alternaria incomplexa]KAI4908356.1 hypothetical protein J4E90_008981 [Alternaria incomplexa]
MTAPSRPEEQEKQLRDKCYNLLRTEAKLAQRLIEEDARHETHFSTELLEKFYRTTTFDLRDHFAKLGAFRSLDRGNLGIIPANYILNVSLFIQCDKYDFDGITAPLASPNRRYRLKPHRALLADLEALFGFKAGTKIDLHLLVNRDWLSNAALSEENIRKARVAKLQEELASLEKDLANTTPTTRDAVEQVARTECQQLTNNIMTKLPREIRDMIYFHLSTRDRELIEREHFRTTLDPITRLYSYDFNRWKAQHFPAHYWNTDYVGQPFYRELVENYYRTSTFLFGDDPGVMKRFLTTDEMKLGIPPKALLSSVEIGLNAVSHDRGSFRAYMFGIPKSPERMREALDGIFELKPGAKIVIRFVTEAKTKEERDEHCKGAMAMLFDDTQVEKMKMYKVKFVVDEGQVWDLAEAMREEWMGIHG